MIQIVDYGLGNVQAFVNVYKRLGIAASRARTPTELDGARHVILPGVGSFDHAIEQFSASGMRDALERLVASDEVYVLGVCVGMQMLADSSEEGRLPGLGWVPGTVRHFRSGEAEAQSLPLPHMGWNDVSPVGASGLFDPTEGVGQFYFLHSYYFASESGGDVIGKTDYVGKFDSAVRHGKVHGVQFHPEKSHDRGEILLRKFAEL